MRALVVGAGAVGQVYGHALVRGGHEVTFLVRKPTEPGFTLFPWNGARASVPLGPCRVVTSPEAGHDAVMLTVPSPALHAPGFLPALVAAVGDATIVTLQPALEDADLVRAHVPSERIVDGLIGFLAYEENGATAYYTPPFLGSAFSGLRADAIARAVRADDLPCRVTRDAITLRTLGGAVLETLVTALSAAHWDRAAFARDRPLRRLAARAAKEALAIAARRRGVPVPKLFSLLGPMSLRLGLAVFARVAPFDVVAFFRRHYDKISNQHERMAARELAEGRELALPTVALEALKRASCLVDT